MDNRHFIYALADPITKEVRYIGKTSIGNERPKQHFYISRNKHTSYKNNWVKSLLTSGLKPEILVIESCKPEDLDEREIYWIAHYKANGCRLTNLTKGGTGGDTGGGQKRRRKIKAKNIESGEERLYDFVVETKKDGFQPSKVAAVCRGRRNSHKGWIFSYLENELVKKEDKRYKKLTATDKEGNITNFDSIKEASKFLKISMATINNAIIGKHKCRKYSFKFT